MSDTSPYYFYCPKNWHGNLHFRTDLLRQATENVEFQGDLMEMCRRDLLFWVNAFCWTYDPRVTPPTLPFITYPFQDVGLLDINDAIVLQEDRLIEKSRDMGLSWMCLIAILWRWMFSPGQSFLLGSRKEELVDKEGDPKSLFWKLDFLLKSQNYPSWMCPRFKRKKLHLANDDNGSTIDGESTNSDFARGDRRTAILLDEFPAVQNGYEILSATADASNCRLFTGTPKGTGNAHYDVREKGHVPILRYHWSVHPLKAIGLYTSVEGVLDIRDKVHVFPDDYPFILDGKLRSPWYDAECLRRVHPVEIAQELDIDYRGSSYQFFEPATIHKLKSTVSRPPFEIGELAADDRGHPGDFDSQDGGRLKLWVILTPEGRPPTDRRYVAGADIAQGTGASNSCLTVADVSTGEQVAEFASPSIRPDRFGTMAAAICRWFGGMNNEGAKLIWEATGPGRGFEDAVKEAGYGHIFYREAGRGVRHTHKFSGVPGWTPTPENILHLLMTFRRSLCDGRYCCRSREALDECLDYEFAANGKIQHVKARSTADPTGANDNHGDRVVSAALANLLLPHTGAFAGLETVERVIPSSCFRARQDSARKAILATGSW